MLKVRPCHSEVDFAAMGAVLQAGRAESPHSVYVHVGDLVWWRWFLLQATPWEEIAYLWQDEAGRVVGWSLFSPGYGAFDLMVTPDYRRSPYLDEMLDWTLAEGAARARRAGRSSLMTVWVFADDQVWAEALAARGLAPLAGATMHYLAHSLDNLPAPVVPAGFRLAPVTDDTVEGRAAAQRAAFCSERMTAAIYHALRAAPVYRADLDRLVIAPGGQVAAFALGWWDEANRVGALEPVGTAPEFAGQGLGKAVVRSALAQFVTLGAQSVTVVVEEDNHAAQRLYRAVGFRQLNTIRAYECPLDALNAPSR